MEVVCVGQDAIVASLRFRLLRPRADLLAADSHEKTLPVSHREGFESVQSFSDQTFCLGSQLVQEANEILTATGLLQLADSFRFDLPDSFACHFEDVTDFLERVAVTIT